MGCSDRFDLEYCEYRLGWNYNRGKPYLCGNATNGGVYCAEHTHQPLRKEDSKRVITKLKKKKERNALLEWLQIKN